VNRVALGSLFSHQAQETEQVIERLFDAAEHAEMLLLFDEDDTLAGRAESGNDENSYNEANMSLLLDRLQRFGGPAIVAASHRSHIDARLLALAHAVIELGGPSPAP
jgi:SpoVK/Ycf46/Vps4 family AAA+-type ATPase